MTAQTLPDCPNYCFVPAYDVETEVQQIRIVIEGMAGHVPTALVTLSLDDALSICDKLNRRLGLNREPGPPWRPRPCRPRTRNPATHRALSPQRRRGRGFRGQRASY